MQETGLHAKKHFMTANGLDSRRFYRRYLDSSAL